MIKIRGESQLDNSNYIRFAKISFKTEAAVQK